MLRILAADIGATNARFALFSAAPDDEAAPLLALERERWLRGAEYPAFADALAALKQGGTGVCAFLPPDEPDPDIAVFAPAGPIQGSPGRQSCRISNLPWQIRSDEIQRAFGISQVHLINDFAAQAYACLIPDSVDSVSLLPGKPVANAPQAVAGAGTGFGLALILPPTSTNRSGGSVVPQGEAVRDAITSGVPATPGNNARQRLLDDLRKTIVLPSEGGHAEFPFTDAREFAFSAFASKRAGVSRLIGDNIVSGSGLGHICTFLTGKELSDVDAAAQATDCPEAVAWFARFYGRACRNYVLATMALGGLFITGGMALRLPVLTHPAFAEEFHTSAAAQRELLERVPVRHIRKPQAGLWGAALYGLLQAGSAS